MILTCELHEDHPFADQNTQQMGIRGIKSRYFFNLGPPKESIFLTTFYGLYFGHQYTNITNYISSWYRPYARVPNTYWNYLFIFKFEQSSSYFHWKILALAGLWTRDLPGSKPICYQLSYPGLDIPWILSYKGLCEKILSCKGFIRPKRIEDIMITYLWKEVNPQCAPLTQGLTLWPDMLPSCRESYMRSWLIK